MTHKSVEAESSLLRILFTSHDYAIEVLQVMEESGVTSDSFSHPQAQSMHRGLCCMRDEGIRIGVDTFLEHSRGNKKLQAYLNKYMSGTQPVESHRYYIGIIREMHTKRRLHDLCAETMANLTDTENSEELAGEMHTKLCAMTTVDPVVTPCMAADSVYNRWDDARNGISIGIPTPFQSFNALTGGPQKGLLCLLAGRQGTGKSIIIAQWLYTLGSGLLSSEPIPCVDFCFEDGIERTLARVSGHAGQFNTYHRDMGNSSDEHMLTARDALDEVKQYPIIYEERPRTVQQIRAQLTRLKMDHGIKIAFIDGWKDLLDDHHRWDANRIDKYNSQHLRDTAKLLDIAIVPVHHLVKMEQGATITAENIRGSGLITADARMAIALQSDKEQKVFHFDLIKTNFTPFGTVELTRHTTPSSFVEAGAPPPEPEAEEEACHQTQLPFGE